MLYIDRGTSMCFIHIIGYSYEMEINNDFAENC